MARFTDWHVLPEIQETMEKFVKAFPDMFQNFNPGQLLVYCTHKKNSRKAIALRSISYPMEAAIGRPYIVEVFDKKWAKLNQAQKNMAVLHVMCAIPDGGFDPSSKYYGRKVRASIEMYSFEADVCRVSGVYNWEDENTVRDPLDASANGVMAQAVIPGIDPDEDAIPDDNAVKRVAVTPETIANI